MRVGVVIATAGRPTELGHLLHRLACQTVPPDRIVVSVAGPGDLPDLVTGDVTVVYGSLGLPAQRNRGLEALNGTCDLIVFFDDDYVPALDVIEGIRTLFAGDSGIAGAHGQLLADGISSAGITYEEALGLLAAYEKGTRPQTPMARENCRAYGCNMVFRASAIGALRFDEALPLYGWQEDFDFASRVSLRGRIVHTDAFVGVHRGVKSGRTSGLRFGYSQIANPLYLARKGTMPLAYALKLIMKNLIANHVRALAPEPWIDRRGRLRGNWLAFAHVFSGRLDPRHITELS